MLANLNAERNVPLRPLTRPAEPHPDLYPRLFAILGSEGLVTEPKAQLPYLTDWLGRWQGRASLIARPASTEQTVAVMRACHNTHTPVVTQGGNTGLSGGATPDETGAQVVLNMGRMNRIRAIDLLHNIIEVEAGVSLAQVQQTAQDAGRFFPLSLGSEGSCTIGGNLATNAGGIAVQRYGNMRNLAIGLEIVLPDGQISNGLSRLRKINSGYDFCQLFIGSEGTLGVITAAALKLLPQPVSTATAWVGTDRLDRLIDFLVALRGRCGDRLDAFEIMSANAVTLVAEHLPAARVPLAWSGPGHHNFHALIEMSDTYSSNLNEQLEGALADSLRSGLIHFATVSSSAAQASALRSTRQCISQAQLSLGRTIRYSICLPLPAIADFLVRADEALHQLCINLQSICFGPLSGGSFHYNVLLRRGHKSTMELEDYVPAVDALVEGLVAKGEGSFTADYGFWHTSRNELRLYKPPIEHDLTMRIKQAFDPNHLMNPGKLL
jgi:FAD/FMN-containing dehydrogenase